MSRNEEPERDPVHPMPEYILEALLRGDNVVQLRQLTNCQVALSSEVVVLYLEAREESERVAQSFVVALRPEQARSLGKALLLAADQLGQSQ